MTSDIFVLGHTLYHPGCHVCHLLVVLELTHDREGSNFDNVFFLFCFFLVDDGGRIQIPLLVGHQRPTGESSFEWRVAGGPMMAQH